MNDIIRQILQMDEQARQMTESAAELRLRTETSMEERRRAVREEYLDKAKAKVAQIEQTEQRMADEEFEQMEREYDRAFAELSEWEEKHSAEWSEKLFRRAVAVETAQ